MRTGISYQPCLSSVSIRAPSVAETLTFVASRRGTRRVPAAFGGVPPYARDTRPCAPTSSLDPVQRARNITALGNVARADRELWDAFLANPEAIAAEAEAAYARLTGRDAPPLETELDLPEGPTEIVRTVRARRVQSFFRAAVLASYEYRCALSDIALPDLLNASHIVPWKTDTARRADPRNGIALNALYDRAFDRGLITFDDASPHTGWKHESDGTLIPQRQTVVRIMPTEQTFAHPAVSDNRSGPVITLSGARV